MLRSSAVLVRTCATRIPSSSFVPLFTRFPLLQNRYNSSSHQPSHPVQGGRFSRSQEDYEEEAERENALEEENRRQKEELLEEEEGDNEVGLEEVSKEERAALKEGQEGEEKNPEEDEEWQEYHYERQLIIERKYGVKVEYDKTESKWKAIYKEFEVPDTLFPPALKLPYHTELLLKQGYPIEKIAEDAMNDVDVENEELAEWEYGQEIEAGDERESLDNEEEASEEQEEGEEKEVKEEEDIEEEIEDEGEDTELTEDEQKELILMSESPVDSLGRPLLPPKEIPSSMLESCSNVECDKSCCPVQPVPLNPNVDDIINITCTCLRGSYITDKIAEQLQQAQQVNHDLYTHTFTQLLADNSKLVPIYNEKQNFYELNQFYNKCQKAMKDWEAHYRVAEGAYSRLTKVWGTMPATDQKKAKDLFEGCKWVPFMTALQHAENPNPVAPPEPIPPPPKAKKQAPVPLGTILPGGVYDDQGYEVEYNSVGLPVRPTYFKQPIFTSTRDLGFGGYTQKQMPNFTSKDERAKWLAKHPGVQDTSPETIHPPSKAELGKEHSVQKQPPTRPADTPDLFVTRIKGVDFTPELTPLEIQRLKQKVTRLPNREERKKAKRSERAQQLDTTQKEETTPPQV